MANSQTDRASREFMAAMLSHRATLDRLLDQRSVGPLKRLYDETQRRLVEGVLRLPRAERLQPLTLVQLKRLMSQIKKEEMLLAARLSAQLAPISREAQVEGIRQMNRTITSLERSLNGVEITLPLLEPSVFSSIIDNQKPALDAAQRRSFARFATRLTKRLEQMMLTSLVEEDTPEEAMVRVQEQAEDDWFMGARIIRTEMAAAYNSAHADSLEYLSPDMPDAYNRWTELVDDETGAPLDDRVGTDSMALHGQVTRPKGVFTMPPDPLVRKDWWGKTWKQSPNRPNDRSVTMPWRPSWGVPGWEWKNGTKVPVK